MLTDPSEWPEVGGYPIKPPRFKKGIGRPKKSRRRTEEEPRSSQNIRRQGGQNKCGICGEFGHNSKGCKKDVVDPKRAERARKDAERMKRCRTKKKMATGETTTTAPIASIGESSSTATRRGWEMLSNTMETSSVAGQGRNKMQVRRRDPTIRDNNTQVFE